MRLKETSYRYRNLGINKFKNKMWYSLAKYLIIIFGTLILWALIAVIFALVFKNPDEVSGIVKFFILGGGAYYSFVLMRNIANKITKESEQDKQK